MFFDNITISVLSIILIQNNTSDSLEGGQVRISNDTLVKTGAPSRVYFREIHRAGYGSPHGSELLAYQRIKKPITAGFFQDPQNRILPADMNRPTSQKMT